MSALLDALDYRLQKLGVDSNLETITGFRATEIMLLMNTVTSLTAKLAELDLGPPKPGAENSLNLNGQSYDTLVANAALSGILVYCNFKYIQDFLKSGTKTLAVEKEAAMLKIAEDESPDNCDPNTSMNYEAQSPQELDSIDVTDGKPVFRPITENTPKPFNYWHLHKRLATMESDEGLMLGISAPNLRKFIAIIDKLPGESVSYNEAQNVYMADKKCIDEMLMREASIGCLNFLQTWLNRLEISLAINDPSLRYGSA